MVDKNEICNIISHTPTKSAIKDVIPTQIIEDNVTFQIKIELSNKKENFTVKDECTVQNFKNEFSLNKKSKDIEYSPLRSKFDMEKESSPIKRWLRQNKTQNNEE